MPIHCSEASFYMSQIQIIRRVTGPYNLNTYFLACKKTRKAVIIDPGSPADALVNFIGEQHIVPEKILNTHGHADQFFSMDDFKKQFDIPYGLHGADDSFFQNPDVQERTRKAVGLPPPYPADFCFQDNETICFGQAALKVIHTPGHTPGSVCFLCDDHLFTGDAVFVGEAGRTDLPGGDLPQLIESIKTRILPLDKKTMIHPGHHHTGDPAQSTLEQEMKTNIYITDFILDV